MPSAIDRSHIKSNATRVYALLYVLTALLMGASFFFDSPMGILRGLWTILTAPSKLITDYFELAGVGATLFNSGMVTLLSIVLVHANRTLVTGPMFAAILTVCGFSFFGKNVFNSIPITFGVYLYARLHQMEFKQVQLVALFSSGLSPLVSELAFGSAYPLYIALPMSYLIGMGVGLVLPPISSICLQFHQGFNLYNVGFTIGIVGMTVTGLLRMRGMDIQAVRVISRTQHPGILFLLSLFFLILLGVGAYLLRGQPHGRIKALYNHSGRLVSDFVSLYDLGPTLVNMGSMGLAALWLIVLAGGIINGPVIGGIFTVVGFSAFGKHPFNTVPVVLGILLAAYFHHDSLTSTSTLLTLLFGTCLAPISGYYGPIYGMVAGYLHMSMVVNVGYLHGGLNLYNNGFSGGFVAAILVTVFESIRQITAVTRKGVK